MCINQHTDDAPIAVYLTLAQIDFIRNELTKEYDIIKDWMLTDDKVTPDYHEWRIRKEMLQSILGIIE